jgi:ribosomal protein S18 acetylase RimI-like enzyme
MVKIRTFQEDDAQQVSKIMIAAFKTFLGNDFTQDDEDYWAPEYLAKISLGKNHFSETISFVAEENGKIRGYVRVTSSRSGLGSFEVVGVDPDCFAKGVGSLLMKEAEKYWQRTKMRKISTCVSAHNKRALIYYIKHGFIPEGYRKDHFRDGTDEIILGKFLK